MEFSRPMGAASKTVLTGLTRSLFGLLLVVVMPMAFLQAAEFRVHTQIFSGDGDLPVSKNTTLFSGGDAYDSIAGAAEVTVFQASENCFYLLDLKRNLKTRITTDELLQYTTSLQEKARKSQDPLLKFCAQPKFELRREKDGKMWIFFDPVLRYQILTDTAGDEEVAKEYRRFCDWYSRLNAMLRPQALLPFPRLVVNERIAREAAIPKTVSLRISAQRRTEDHPVEIRSVHSLKEKLSPTDKKRVELVQEHLATFEEATVARYRANSQTARK